jgi:hemerythrin-like domain-containing protein
MSRDHQARGRRDIFAAMRLDHERVLADLTALERAAAGVGQERERNMGAVLAGMERQFATHMAAEDELLFPALLLALPGTAPQVRPLSAEHDDLRSMLAGLRRTLTLPPGAARDEQLLVQARDFAELLRIHIRKEEAVVFRLAEPVLGDRELDALARRLEGSRGGAAGGDSGVHPDRKGAR